MFQWVSEERENEIPTYERIKKNCDKRIITLLLSYSFKWCGVGVKADCLKKDLGL